MRYPNYITLERGEMLLLSRSIRNALANSYFYEVLDKDEYDTLEELLAFIDEHLEDRDAFILLPERVCEDGR